MGIQTLETTLWDSKHVQGKILCQRQSTEIRSWFLQYSCTSVF